MSSRKKLAVEAGLGALLGTACLLLLLAAAAEAASGTWERAWGKNVSSGGGAGFGEICVVASDCQAGGIATAFGGEFNYPQGVETDAAGNVYVADAGNNRIQKFDSAGNFLLAWGKNVSISGGSGFLEVCTAAIDCKAGETSTQFGGELSSPVDVAVDPAGNVYVGDNGNQRIQKFNGNGVFERAWGRNVSISDASGAREVCTVATDCQDGEPGAAGGEFSSPEGIAADGVGVYVTETSNSRIQRFDSAGSFVLAWGEDVISGPPVGFEVCTVAANCKAAASAGDALGGEVADPWGITTDQAGRVVVGDSNNDRLQRFDSAGNFQLAWGRDVVSAGPGNTGTEFEICVAANGDTCKSGNASTEFGGNVNFPQGVAVDTAGAIYVSDQQFTRIQKFGPDLNFLSAWGNDVISGAPAVYEVCTAAASCQEGTFPPVTSFGGDLRGPYGIAVDQAGNVYVADTVNARIQKFADPPAAAPPVPPASVPVTVTTGQRAAALKKCKKKRSKKVRRNCIKRAKKLPV